MGIKNLLKFLNNFPELIVDQNVNDLSGKKIAIDISILLYQVVISVRNSGADLTNKKGEITSHLLGIFNKTCKLLSKKIIPVYVFDGKPPEIKRKVLNMRKNIRMKAYEKMLLATTLEEKIKYFKRSVTITKKQLDDCRLLLTFMGVPFIDAPEEADSQCAWLAKNGLVDAVLTEDMDILTFGSPCIIRNLTSFKNSPLQINLNMIKEKFDWSHENFVHFCILLGCDYCDGLNDINYMTIFNTFQKTKDIDKTLESFNRKVNYKIALSYFNKPLIDDSVKELKLKKPNIDLLNNLLVNISGLIKYRIQKKLNYLLINYNNINKLETIKYEVI
jgi:flap endonuclease-1